jgi:hypothetical protein
MWFSEIIFLWILQGKTSYLSDKNLESLRIKNFLPNSQRFMSQFHKVYSQEKKVINSSLNEGVPCNL